jgi:hypothetical protein
MLYYGCNKPQGGHTMKKFTARTNTITEAKFDDLDAAIKFIGDCRSAVGTIYRNSTNAAIYQIERGRLNFDRRLKREK